MTPEGRSVGFSRPSYYRRLLSNYVLRRRSHLSFWHEAPQVNPAATYDRLGPYYMTFRDKASYPGPFDSSGVPLLAYGGAVGLQHNPISIAQFGLAHYNCFAETGDLHHKDVFLRQADWLVDNLTPNSFGVPVWLHRFDWEYRAGLKAPWPSGLAQGAGISCLVRAAALTDDPKYETSLRSAFASFLKDVREGGVCFHGDGGEVWIEEYIVDPPSHVLNGLIWALWGVRDYLIHTGDGRAQDLFQRCVATLRQHLPRYDTGLWSLYEITPYRLKNIASPFYHRLHIVQLTVMHRLTGDPIFSEYATRWSDYQGHMSNRWRSRAYKVLFKLMHY